MDKILHYLRPLIRLNYKRPYLVVAGAVILAAILGNYAVQLKIDTDLANLLPEDNEHVKAMERLEETVGGETAMAVAIKSPSFEDNKRFAQDLIKQSLELQDHKGDRPFFERAEFHKDTDFLRNNALYFATPRELDAISSQLEEEIHSAKEEANPFLMDFDDEDEDEGASSKEELKELTDSYEDLIPAEYPISPDSTIMVFKLYPTGSKSDLDYLRRTFSTYDSLVTAMNPQSYNGSMEVRFGGRLQRHLHEIDSIMNDVFNSFASGISSVMILVVLYFFLKKYNSYRKGSDEGKKHSFWEHFVRIPVPIFVIGIPLVASLSWTFGLTYFVLGSLNTMTSVLFVILFGMGIDYGIHFYARYLEFRSDGHGVPESLYHTYTNTAPAIVVSGLTTAFSLFVLVIAQFRGFSEFGFIAGTGIIMALICMLFVLPALLVISERFNWILLNPTRRRNKQKDVKSQRFPWARTILGTGLIIALASGFFSFKHLGFQYDFGKLEPEFPEYEKFNEFAGQVSQSDKRNPAYILADNHQQVVEVLEKLRHKMRSDSNTTILDVEALPERFPPNEQLAKEKLQQISHIRELLDDPFIKNQDNPQLNKLRRASQTTKPIGIDQIPDFFKNRFINKEGEIGNFVVVYPSVGLSHGDKSIAFKDEIGEITLENGEKVYAASTSIIAAEMLDVMRTESPYMVGLTFLAVFILMYVSFKSLKWTLIALMPLVVGLLWLFGTMLVTGLMFNFYNLVVLPAILGIGEDTGVHLAARYREEGERNMWQVLSNTGQYVTIATFTTLLGFSGLLLTNHPGLQSLGLIAVIGIAMPLLTSMTFLPALIQWLEDHGWISY